MRPQRSGDPLEIGTSGAEGVPASGGDRKVLTISITLDPVSALTDPIAFAGYSLAGRMGGSVVLRYLRLGEVM